MSLPALWLAPAWWALGYADRALAMLRLAERQGVPQRVYVGLDLRFAALRAPSRGGGRAPLRRA